MDSKRKCFYLLKYIYIYITKHKVRNKSKINPLVVVLVFCIHADEFQFTKNEFIVFVLMLSSSVSI